MASSPSYIRVDGYLYRRADELPDRARVEKEIAKHVQALFELWLKYHLEEVAQYLPEHIQSQELREKKFADWFYEIIDLPLNPAVQSGADEKAALPHLQALFDVWQRYEVPHSKLTSFDDEYKQTTVRDTFARWAGGHVERVYPGAGL